MSSPTFTARIDAATKRRLEKLTLSVGRSRPALAIEAAIQSLDRGEGVPHDEVKRLVRKWRDKARLRQPKRGHLTLRSAR